MIRNINIDLVYQPLISGPPPQEGDLYAKACSGDSSTINHWRETWLKNYKATHERFGEFGEHSVGQLFGKNKHKPAIVIGSGPSLKYSLEGLKENMESKTPLVTVSALHNFGYFEDNGLNADYYVSLDAGPIVIKDVFEGREKDPEHYWNQTKDKTLIAYVASDPALFDKWQGKVLLFNSLIPNKELREETVKIQPFSHYLSTGGNCLGACMYTAKAIMGSSKIIYVGADFCFDYDNTFHAYKTSYDDLGGYVLAVDVFGNMRKTWQSYKNFKFWFDHIACNVPGEWVTCSEGLLGAYRDGNIRQFQYCDLKTALIPYKSADTLYLEDRAENTKVPFDLEEFWGNSKNDKHLTFF